MHCHTVDQLMFVKEKVKRIGNDKGPVQTHFTPHLQIQKDKSSPGPMFKSFFFSTENKSSMSLCT